MYGWSIFSFFPCLPPLFFPIVQTLKIDIVWYAHIPFFFILFSFNLIGFVFFLSNAHRVFQLLFYFILSLTNRLDMLLDMPPWLLLTCIPVHTDCTYVCVCVYRAKQKDMRFCFFCCFSFFVERKYRFRQTGMHSYVHTYTDAHTTHDVFGYKYKH